jgi:predicted Zn-dependent protease
VTDAPGPRIHRMRMLAAAAVAMTLALLCAYAPASAASQHDDDAALGRSVYNDLRAKSQIVDDSRYLPLVRRVGARISSVAGPHWFTERFYVVRGNDVNAFSAPGGYVFVNEGLLRTVDNVDELANVLGHETAHLVLGHVQAAVQQHKRKTFISNIGKMFAQRGSQGAQNTFDVASKMGNYSFLNFTRQQEYAADELGVQLAAKARYNPWGTVWFFEQLQRLVGDAGYEQYVQQHPSTADRIAKIKRFLHDKPAYKRWNSHQPPTSGLM